MMQHGLLQSMAIGEDIAFFVDKEILEFYNADLWIPPAKKGVDRQSARDYLLDKLKDDKDKDIVRGMGTYTLECVAIHTSTEYNNALLTNLYRINRVVIKRALKRVMLGWVSDDKITISIQIGQN
ncbi:hypothetical protein ACJX0J_037278 [Zea mays]